MKERVALYHPGRGDIDDLISAVLNEKYQSLAMPFYFRELDVTIPVSVVFDTVIPWSELEPLRTIDYVYDVDRKHPLLKKSVEWYELQEPTMGHPDFFVSAGEGLLLFPNCQDTVISLRVRGRRMPEVLVEDSDTPVIPVDWHPIICKLAASEIHSIFGSTERMMELKNEALGDIATRQEDRTMDRSITLGSMHVTRGKSRG